MKLVKKKTSETGLTLLPLSCYYVMLGLMVCSHYKLRACYSLSWEYFLDNRLILSIVLLLISVHP